jgi:hypothetical protein
MKDSQDLILLFKIATDMWKNFSEMYRQFGHMPSKRPTSPLLHKHLRIIIVNTIYYFGLDDDDDDDSDNNNEVAATSVVATADMVIRTLITTLLFSSLSLPYFSIFCNL